MYLENPAQGQWLGPIVEYDDVGEQSYRGLKLSFRRRADHGLSLSGNYTLSHCEADTEVSGSFSQFANGYLNPNDPSFDRGNCTQNRRQIGNLSVGAQTPQFDNAALRALASDWRFSGIFSARSGSWLTVTTGRDIAGTGIAAQRVNQVLDDPYGDKTPEQLPESGGVRLPGGGRRCGDHRNASIEGPGFWTVDLAMSQARVGGVSADAWSCGSRSSTCSTTSTGAIPNANLDAGTFGRITAQSGEMRVMQFGLKYGF